MRGIAMILALLKNTVFLVTLCLLLAISTASLAVKTLSLGAKVAAVTAGAASAQHQAVASAVARTKAKARLRRTVVMVPVVGIAAVGYFEEQDYQEWKEENPELGRSEYACEVSQVSAEVIDDMLQGLPEHVRPSREFVLAKLPDCASHS
ncbi:MAG: hypothetical protein ABJF50_01150 [Paracoccaceae bacterium]